MADRRNDRGIHSNESIKSRPGFYCNNLCPVQPIPQFFEQFRRSKYSTFISIQQTINDREYFKVSVSAPEERVAVASINQRKFLPRF